VHIVLSIPREEQRLELQQNGGKEEPFPLGDLQEHALGGRIL